MNGRIRLLKREIINEVSNTFFAEIRGGPVRSQTIHVRSLHAADFHRWRATIGDYSRTRHARCTSRCQVSSICWINCQLSAARSLRLIFFRSWWWNDSFSIPRCGQETRVIPRILQMRMHWLKSERENLRLSEAGISKEVSSEIKSIQQSIIFTKNIIKDRIWKLKYAWIKIKTGTFFFH